MRIETRRPIPGKQSAMWRCTTEPCTGIWHVAWTAEELTSDPLAHALEVHGTSDVWLRSEGEAK